MVRRTGWVAIVVALMVVALWMDLQGAPDDAVLGASQRIFYIHMGAAVAAAVAFTVTLVASIGFLLSKNLRYDVFAAASAELGTLFTSMVLLTGILWGRVAWGVWWTWDPRITATALLWMLFSGYLLWRESLDDWERRARVSAVVAIVAYLDVPLDYMTIRWWRSIHPVVLTIRGIHMAPSMVWAMALSEIAMLGVYVVWMRIRVTLFTCEYEIVQAKNLRRLGTTSKGV